MLKTVSELVKDGFTLNFTKNFIVMEWQSYREEEVVNSKRLASDLDDQELYITLDRMISTMQKKIQRREKRWRMVADKPYT